MRLRVGAVCAPSKTVWVMCANPALASRGFNVCECVCVWALRVRTMHEAHGVSLRAKYLASCAGVSAQGQVASGDAYGVGFVPDFLVVCLHSAVVGIKDVNGRNAHLCAD
jgi:hypothetical protein